MIKSLPLIGRCLAILCRKSIKLHIKEEQYLVTYILTVCVNKVSIHYTVTVITLVLLSVLSVITVSLLELTSTLITVKSTVELL